MTAKSRDQRKEILIDVPKEAVWRALTTAEGLAGWYVEEAKVEPGQGGTQWISWGEGQEVTATHLIWRENEHLRLGQPGDPAQHTGWEAIVHDWTLEDRGEETRVRLLQSGVPDGPEWDSTYEGTDRGWTLFLLALKYYLEHQPGKVRRTVHSYRNLPLSVDEAWQRLAKLLVGDHALPATGEEYSVLNAFGEPMSGRVLINEPWGVLAMTIDQLRGALLGLTLHRTQQGAYLNFILGTYGLDEAIVAALKDRWLPALDRALAVPAPQQSGR